MSDRTNKFWWWAAAGVGSLLAGKALVRYRRSYDLKGKNVFITGGSRGLGLVMGREFARHGAKLIITARDPGELDRGQDDLIRHGAPRVLALACDITEPAEAQEVVNEILRRWGRIDVLVNNAGIIQVGPMEVMTLADYDRAMKTHYWGPVMLTLAVLPGMRERREGRIVNISSIGGKVSVPHLLPYAGSKFALTGFSEGLRAELLKDNIYVTTVIPGLMRTGSHVNAEFKGRNRAEYAWFSISDALPLFSTSAEHAARRIVRACKYGQSEIILTLPAQMAVYFHGLFPGLTADILGMVNRLLPGPGGVGFESIPGKESTSAVAPSVLTALADKASQRNNELAPGEQLRQNV